MNNDLNTIINTLSTNELEEHYNLPQAVGDQQFFLHKGAQLHDMLELKKAFETMSQEQYDFHVTKDKNDFAAWVEFVLQDKQCARALRKARTIKTSIRAIDRYLERYKKYA